METLNLHELFQFRDLLLALAQRDIKLRYRQTALGVLWVVLQPLLAAGIFSFVFGTLAKVNTDGRPAFLFSFTSLLAWNAFAITLAKVSISLIGNNNLISKIYFPRLALPLSLVFSTLIDFTVGLCLLPILLIVAQVTPTFALLLMPLALMFILLLALGVGLFTSALTVSYRDVQYILPVITQFLLFGTPISYSIIELAKNLSPVALSLYYLANPLAPLIAFFRWTLIGTALPPWYFVVYGALVSIGLFFAGAFAFRNMERRFADVI